MEIRPLADADRDWVERLILQRWGDTVVVGRGKVWRPADLPGFGAFENDRCVGLVTYEVDGEACEVVTIDALEEARGPEPRSSMPLSGPHAKRGARVSSS